jgi:hypothetical protein
MASFFVRSRPTAHWATGAWVLGQKVVSTSSTTGLGVCFEVTTAGTASGSEPSWNLTIGATTTDSGGVVWTTRGAAGLWLASKTWALGDRVIKTSRSTLTAASSVVWKCTTAGAGGSSEPSWPTTITSGTTTQADSSATWTAMACTTWDNANPFMDGLLKDTANSTVKVAAGDTIYVSKTHTEATLPGSFSNLTWLFPGTAAAPNLVICCDDTGQLSTPTTLSAARAATVTLSSGNSGSQLALAGHAYIYGVTFVNNCATTSGQIQVCSSASTHNGFYLDGCGFTLGAGNSASFNVQLGASTSTATSRVTLNNTIFTFGATGQVIRLSVGEILWKNTGSTAISGTVPTAGLFDANSGAAGAGNVQIDGVDLSGLGANTLFSANINPTSSRVKLSNCKLNASTTVGGPTAANLGFGSVTIDLLNCDSSGTNYKLHRSAGSGTIDQELTNIMTGGASDGTTGIAWKMVSNANAQWAFPLESFPIVAWNNNSGGSKTATVEILTDSSSQLNNDDVWLELEYLADSGDPLAGFANNSKANILASNAAQGTSSVTWTTTGITNVMKQHLQQSFTPQQNGPVVGVVKLSKAGTTIRVNPVLSIA